MTVDQAENLTLLKTTNIRKSFMDNVALGDVSLSLFSGECLALVGENGAGKSTLMKILSGVYKKDSGRIYVKEQEVDITNPKMAQELGISIIHQEFNLIPDLTVAENIFLGREKVKGIFIDSSDIYKQTQQLLDHVKVNINPKSFVRELTIAEKQITEIVKALSLNAEIIIMDEPSASLNINEVSQLFEIIKKLKDEGKGIIYISHRLEELMVIADRVSVLRDGILVKELAKGAEIDEIIEYMVGRKIENLYPDINSEVGKSIFEVNNLSATDQITEINFSVREGEIIGIAGLMGSGQTQLARALYGMSEVTNGHMTINGEMYKNPTPKKSIEKGLGLVSEDRKDEGLVFGMSIASNITLSNLTPTLNGIKLIDEKKELSIADQYKEKLGIRAVNCMQEAILLSGGNQQKVVLSKVLLSNPNVIIMCDPTRGVDINAKVEIYKLIHQFILEKKAVILISSELPEILGLSNRVLVMAKGKIVAEFSHEEATQEKIMYYATGGSSS